MRCAVAKGLFELVHDLASLVGRQPFVGDGGSGDVATELLELVALIGLTAGGRVERKARLFGEQGGREGFRLRRDCAQCQCFATRIGADGDAVVDGGTDQLVDCFSGLEIEVVVLGVTDEEAVSFEQPGDACADGV